jgi:hypothetical protein
MQPDQPPHEPVRDRYDIPTDSPKYPRTPDPYPLPGKPPREA